MRLIVKLNGLILFAILWLAGCHRERNYSVSPTPSDKKNAPLPNDDVNLTQALPSDYFINRLSTKLRNGALICTAEAEQLKKMTTTEMVDYFLKDPRFINTVFDFTIYFLGFKNPNLKFPSERSSPFAPHLGFMSSAITAAQQMASGGDYLKLFDFYQPTYAFPLAEGLFKIGDFSLDFTKRRQQSLNNLERIIKRTNRLLENTDAPTNLKEFCSNLNDIGPDEIANSLREIDNSQISSSFYFLSAQYFEESRTHCKNPEEVAIPQDFRTAALESIAAAQSLRDYFLSRVKTPYVIQGPVDFRVFDLRKFGESEQSLQTRANAWFWTTLPNSSTNYNRKRASYILKRFMCDDLTPIAVDLPKIHSDQNRHASDAGCYACHYKLDPIAGYFRNYGSNGRDYQNEKNIYFDDEANIPREQYTAAWQDPEDPTKLKIGIIRSSTDAANNILARDDESDPAALFRLLRDLPEVRQCLVKTAIKYLVDERISIDHGYLRYLTEEFNSRVKENSSTALRELFANIVTSNAFSQENLEEGQCYDYAPGVKSTSRPPCLIADTLEQHCVRCHSGNGDQGGLNLQDWNNGFSHLDGNALLSRKESFQRIAAALNTTDATKRMPLDTYMPPADRELLFRFFSKE